MKPHALAAIALVTLLACATGPARAHLLASDTPPPGPAPAASTDSDTVMVFTPDRSAPADTANRPMRVRSANAGQTEWLRAPFGDELITHPDPWRARHAEGGVHFDCPLDYNRVDLVRYGVWWQAQRPETMYPRLGARLEYATGRRRALYGVQLEQPLLPTARFVFGVGMTRRTDHGDLQQIEDAENSLLLLLAHEDWRDYFETEGAGAYLAWRVPDFSTVSVHIRGDRYRSLVSSRHIVSWFREHRALRANPAIDDGQSNSVLVRLERLAHRSRRNRSGLYHWIELERSGGATLRGDYDFVRALADVRSIIRVLPGITLSLRMVGGSTLQGTLPSQREFVIGGVDGLRAHSFGSFRGDRIAVGQAEYSIGLHSLRSRGRHRHRGPQALVFVDSGTAWSRAERPGLMQQRFAVDGGVGLATPDDDLRITFARDLQRPDAGTVIAMRLQRPF